MRAALLTTGIVLLVLLWTWHDRVPEWDGQTPTEVAGEEAAEAEDEADVAAPPPGEEADVTAQPFPAEEIEASPLERPTYHTAAGYVRPLPRTHTVVAGESLEAVAELYYGDPARASDVLEANRERIDERTKEDAPLPVGTILILP